MNLAVLFTKFNIPTFKPLFCSVTDKLLTSSEGFPAMELTADPNIPIASLLYTSPALFSGSVKITSVWSL